MRSLKFLALAVLSVILLSGCAGGGSGGGGEEEIIILLPDDVGLEIDASRVPQFNAVNAANPATCFLDIVNLDDGVVEFSRPFTVGGNLFDTLQATLLPGDYIIGWDCQVGGNFVWTTNPVAIEDPIAIDFLDVNATVIFLLVNNFPEFQINTNKVGTLEVVDLGIIEPAARILIDALGIIQLDFPSPGRVLFAPERQGGEDRLNAPH